ncbi:SRPBCC domain-containing protein [Gryllotalpicola daejeonensis]|uniref:SRPBCC domain-containing protein n=1 Tax=Gryllotalpicola daejeonensis TaxID=993087 RepID=A0ABP7ZD80_9MICO
MPVISSERDAEARSLTIVCEFPAPVERIWQLWEDPRQLEKWWCPEPYPATFETHDLTPGGTSEYFNTGPNGEFQRAWWATTAVDKLRRIEFDGGLADNDTKAHDPDGVMHGTITLEPIELGGKPGTRMTALTVFDSVPYMEKMLAMGHEEGSKMALSQIDGLLTGIPA